jgi:hypothetical protein
LRVLAVALHPPLCGALGFPADGSGECSLEQIRFNFQQSIKPRRAVADDRRKRRQGQHVRHSTHSVRVGVNFLSGFPIADRMSPNASTLPKCGLRQARRASNCRQFGSCHNTPSPACAFLCFNPAIPESCAPQCTFPAPGEAVEHFAHAAVALPFREVAPSVQRHHAPRPRQARASDRAPVPERVIIASRRRRGAGQSGGVSPV